MSTGVPPEAPWPSAPPGQSQVRASFPVVGAHRHPVRRFSHRTVVVAMAIGLAVLSLLLVLVTELATPGPPPHCRLLQCQGPPIGHRGGAPEASTTSPIQTTGTLYRSSSGFSFRYPTYPGGPKVSTGSSGIQLTYSFSDGSQGSIAIAGGTTGGLSAEQIVQSELADNFPNAQLVYQLPDALVGYKAGYGEALDDQLTSQDGSTTTYRIITEAAVVRGFGIVVIAFGPLIDVQGPRSMYFNGHASPANLNVAYAGGDGIVDSIVFPS
ncbi:MAG: hypothetical protein ACRDVW_09860 [Acidimicrobiales bacterium]